MTPPGQDQGASCTGEDAAPTVGEYPDTVASKRMVDHALDYAVRGWAVLPLAGKQPHNRRGVTDASRDLDTIRSWWSRWPEANIGARVPKDYVVLDVDPRNGGRTDALFDGVAVTVTLTVLTGRGDGGMHLYYRRPESALSAARLPVGVDLKVSGYMVMPPSLHPDTGIAYDWYARPVAPLPEHLVRMLTPTLRLVSNRPTPGVRPSKGSVVARLDGLTQHLRAAVEGERNARLYWTACRVGDMLVAGDLPNWRLAADALATVALEIGLEAGEVGDTIESGFKASGVIA